MIAFDAFHFGFGSEENRDSLMVGRRDNVQISLVAVGGGPASLLNDMPHGVCFVHQAQLSTGNRVSTVLGIQKYTAPSQNAVNFSDHGNSPPHVKALGSRSVFASDTLVEITLNRRLPLAIAGGVDREFGCLVGNGHIGIRETEFPGSLLMGEAVYTISNCHHQRGRRAVDGISSANLLVPRAQDRKVIIRINGALDGNDRKNGTN